jgi:hypothetical protein
MKGTNGTRFGRLLMAFACLALVGSSSIALARGGSSRKAMIAPKSVGSVTATCPKGTGVVASGFAAPHFSPRNDRSGVARIASRRVGKRRLKTSGFNFGEQAGELASLAYCAKAGRSVRVTSDKVYVAPKSADVAIATCPGGSEVISGGFATPGFSDKGPRILPLTSKRVGKSQWRVEAANMGGDDSSGQTQEDRAGTLVAYAYCLDDGPKIVTRHKRKATGEMGVAKAVKVRCPRGMKALSGGFDANLYFSANPTAAGVIASKRVGHGRAWRLAAISISNGSATVTAYAYCMPRHR